MLPQSLSKKAEFNKKCQKKQIAILTKPGTYVKQAIWRYHHGKSKLQILKHSNFEIKKKPTKTRHMKFVQKICKYDMDLGSIAEDIQWTGFCPQTQW